jgi:hypothetical protein
MIQVIERPPLNYVLHLIDIHQYEQAIETLEQGRALLWSKSRGLHTSIQHIANVNPLLAEKLTAISRDLEELTMLVLPIRGSKVDSGDGDSDPFRHLMMTQWKLLEEHNNLISQVQSLPGLQIILTHSKSHSDILILLHNASPSLIQTSKGFYDDANRLRDDLLCARKTQKWGPRCHRRYGKPLDCSDWCAKSSAIEMKLGVAASQAGSRENARYIK